MTMAERGESQRFFIKRIVIPLYVMLILLLFFVLSNPVGSDSIVSGCQVLNESTVYLLDEDINASGTCFTVTGNDLTLDCQLHRIMGDGSGAGISFFNNSLVTIKNCVFEQFDTGLDVYESFIRVETTLLERSNRGILTRGYFYVDAELNSFRNNTLNIENTNESVLFEAQNNWFGSNDSMVINASVSGNVSIPFWLEEDPFADHDLDIVFDFVDNCAVANTNQSDGDDDGFGDVCDNCVMDYNPFQGDLDNDTYGDVCDYDADDDTICDFGSSLIEPLPENVARDKAINASVFVDPYVPLFAVDGDNTTFLAIVGEPPQYVTIDLGAIIPLDRFVIVFNDSLSRLYDYTVELSEDGNNFSTVVAIAENEEVRNDLSFNLTPARFVRLTLLDYDFDDDDVRINEIELYSGNLLCKGGVTEEDVCPTIANPDQNDSDADGRGNECDNCPFADNPDQDDADLDEKGDACDQNLFLLNSVYDPLTEEANISSQFLTDEDTGYYVIQFYDFLMPDQSQELEGMGVAFLEYIPEKAYIVFFDPLIKSQIQNLSYVRFLGIFQPADRLSRSLYSIIDEELLEENVTLNLTVFTFQNVQGVNESITHLGANVQYILNDSLGVETEVRNILNISFIPDISSVAILPAIEFFGFKTPITLGVRKSSFIGEDQNYYGYEGEGQVIGHLDTGVDASHLDYQGQVILDKDIPLWKSYACIGLYPSYPFGIPGTGKYTSGVEIHDGKDKIGHGTSTGGVAVGLGDAGRNVPGQRIRGIAPRATLFTTKVCNAAFTDSIGLDFPRTLFTGRFPEWDVILAFDNSYEQKARVHTNSWGTATGPSTFKDCRLLQESPLFEYREYDVRINDFVFHKQDFLPVFAASNTGRDADETLIEVGGYPILNTFKCSVYETSQGFGWGNLANPGVAKNVLTVGGLEQLLEGCYPTDWYKKEDAFWSEDKYTAKSCHRVNSDTDLWGGSSRGPTPDLRLKPDVVAPATGRFILQSHQMGGKISEHYVSTLGGDLDGKPSSNADNYHFGSQYRVSMGTSFATPAAAAIAALIREYYQKEQTIEKPSAALLKATVINGAQDVPDRTFIGNDHVALYSQTGPIPNFREGWGRVNFSNSIKPCWPYQCFRYRDNEIVENEKKVIFPYRFSSDRALGMTLTWTDPADSSSTSKSLINELDLEMTSPSGIKYKSTFNNINEDGESVDESAKDYCRLIYVDQDTITDENHVMTNIKASASSPLRLRCNEPEKIKSNVKRLIRKEPEDGFWNITIKGKTVDTSFTPNGQNFALVVSGVRGIDAANESDNATHFFPYGNLIYAYAQGLPSETLLQLVVVANRDRFHWDETITISESGNKNEAINGFTLFTYKETATTDNVNGTLPKKTLLWDPTDPTDPGIFKDLKALQEAIFNAKGKFNVFVDFGEDPWGEINFDSIQYDVKGKNQLGWPKKFEDLVDYHKTVGFRIGYAAASDVPFGTFDDISDEFAWGQSSQVAVTGVGFEPKSRVDVYITRDSGWNNKQPIDNPIKQLLGVEVGEDGVIGAVLWTGMKRQDFGLYNIIVDVNQNGIFDRATDVVSDFKVTCKPEDISCGTVVSAKDGKPEDTFVSEETITADFYLFKKDEGDGRVYVIKESSPIGELDGTTLKDVTEEVETVFIYSQYTRSFRVLWKDTTPKKTGKYHIIVDIDEEGTPGYGVFNLATDLYDPDGFVVTENLREQAIAVDSQGNLHVVAKKELKEPGTGYPFTQILYAKVPANQNTKIDLEDPALFDWSKKDSVVFTVVDESWSGLVHDLDIAIDTLDQPHIAYVKDTKINIDFNYIIYLKLAVNDDPETLSAKVVRRELVYYRWQDFLDVRLNSPRIAINPTTNEPIITTKIVMNYPDLFYFTNIYPSCLRESQPSPTYVFLSPFIIFDTSLPIPKPTAFLGQSIQMITREEGFNNNFVEIPEWPYDGQKFPDSGKLYAAAYKQVSLCAQTTIHKSPPHWRWTTIDESSSGKIHSYSLHFPNLALDQQGIPHVAYISNKDTRREGESSIYYQKISGDYPYPEIEMLTTAPEFTYPGIDVGDDGTAYITWQSEDQIYYRKGSFDHPEEPQVLANLGDRFLGSRRPAVLAKPQLGVDAEGTLHILYLNSVDDAFYFEDPNKLYDWYMLNYIKGKKTDEGIDFLEPVTLSDSAEFLEPRGEIAEPDLTISKLARKNDWIDKVYVSWLETNGPTVVKYRRTTPHVVLVLIPGGMAEYTLFGQPDRIPQIQKLLEETNGVHSWAISSDPGTTMTSQASLFTGLLPKHHQIIGDNFKRGETEYHFVPDQSPALSEVDAILKDLDVPTLFDYLESNGRSKAGLPSIYAKGIGTQKPDFRVAPLIDFRFGRSDDTQRVIYLSTFKNNDNTQENNIADLVVAYFLKNDFKTQSVWYEGMDPEQKEFAIDPYWIDLDIGGMVEQLKRNHVFDDAIIIITSDFGLRNVEQDDIHALTNDDLQYLNKPEGMEISDLFLNGRRAYSSDGLDVARVFSNSSRNPKNRFWFGGIDVIYLKIDGVYNSYSFDGKNDILTPTNEFRDLMDSPPFDESPPMILVASYEYYFHESGYRKVMYGDQTMVPFVVAGNGYNLFTRGNDDLAARLAMVDLAPTIAYFVGGQKLVDTMVGIDGKNAFTPKLTIEGGSPVHFHLYDSLGRHLGPNDFGDIDAEIPGSDYTIDETTGKQKLTLLDINDTYRFEVEGTGYGSFDVSIHFNDGSEQWDLTYPPTRVTQDSRAIVNLSGDFTMLLDYDGDDIFETTVVPLKTILITENTENNTAQIRILSLPAPEIVTLDVSRSTNAFLTIKTKTTPITNGVITLSKTTNTSFNTPLFFTFDTLWSINLTDPVLTNAKKINLTLQYPEYELLPRNIAETSIAIYDATTLEKLDSHGDTLLNRVTVSINKSGDYLLAATDRVPEINNITLTPAITNIPGTVVLVTATITDDSIVTSAIVTLGNETMAMDYNISSQQYEAVLTGPEDHGEYPVIITATDDTNNTVTESASFMLDLEAPLLVMISPENITYLTNRIDLNFYTDEVTVVSYSLDDGEQMPLNATQAYVPATYPLVVPGGNHSLMLVAADLFNNTHTEGVNFSVAFQNAKVSALELPLYARPNELFSVKATIENTMIENLSNIEVQLIVDGNLSHAVRTDLSGESSKDLFFSVALLEGRPNITVSIIPTSNETFVEDNSLSKDILITQKVPVLLVNDDPNSNTTVYTKPIQESTGLGYDVVVHDNAAGIPTTAVLDLFRIVVWVTGVASEQSLDSYEQARLQQYLDNGGNLLVFSNSLGSKRGTTDFYQHYLSAIYRRAAPTNTIEGVFRDPVGKGLLFTLTQSGEELQARAPATESLEYSNADGAAVKYEGTTFKTAYYAFGLEDVPDQETRKTLVERTFAYFAIDFIPPAITKKEPVDNTSFPVNTSSIILSLATDEPATCRYSFTTTEYSTMLLFNETGETSHSTELTNLSNGLSYTVILNCRDKHGNQNSKETILFFIQNRTFFPPELGAIPDMQIAENETLTIQLNVSDPEGDPLNITITDHEVFGYVPLADRFVLTNTTFSLQTNFTDAGQYQLTVLVNDGFATVTTTFSLLIENVNRPPLLTPLGSQHLLEDQYYSVEVHATDPDGEDLLFADNATFFVINPVTGKISFTPKNIHRGEHIINISVSDGEATVFELVPFTITNTNDAPVMSFIAPQRVQEGTSFNLQVLGADADGDTISFSDNTDLFNISSDGSINVTLTNEHVGVHLITITATDGLSNDTKLLNLVVDPFNQPPIFQTIPTEIYVMMNSLLEINVTACDPDLDPECVP